MPARDRSPTAGEVLFDEHFGPSSHGNKAAAYRPATQNRPSVQAQHRPLEHATPGVLLGTRELHDPDTLSKVGVDHLAHGAGACRST